MTSTLSQPDAASAPPVDRTVVLPPRCATVAAEDVRVRLVLAADFDGAMTVDASQVESVGQAVLQVLVAARREACATGQRFAIVDPSAAFVERVSRCRLADDLGLAITEETAQ